MRAVLFLAVLLAGCAATPAPAPPPAPASGPVTFWLTGDGFSAAAPGEGDPVRVPSGNFFDAWANGEGLPTWRGEALAPGATFLATAVRVVAWAESPSGAAQGGRFPSYIAYVGNEGFLQGQASLPPLGVVPPGDRRELTFDLALPLGGLVLRGDEPLELLLTPVQSNDDRAQSIEFLVGSAATPSRIELEGAAVVLPGAVEGESHEQDGRHTGTLSGSAYAPTGPVEGVSAATFPFEVPEGAREVVVTMTVTSNVGIPDVDLTVYAPDGEAAANSVTPYGVEAVRLLAPNLGAGGPGTWNAEVVDYGSATADFELTIAVR